MDRLFRSAAGLAAIGLVALLAGCIPRPAGDFGRAEINPINDEVMPAVGALRAGAAKEPVSAFNLTDKEREMRDRIWRYLVSPHAYDWFGDAVVELQRTRIAAASDKTMPVDRYYIWLHGERFASSHVRYNRIADDVATDIGTMPATFAAICAVQDGDRQRGVASNNMPDLEESMRVDAAARQAENEQQIGWFVRAATNRYQSYGYALDHLLVETPHEEAVKANDLLTQLAIYVEAAQRGDFCTTDFSGGNGRATAIRSRVLQSDRPVKGS